MKIITLDSQILNTIQLCETRAKYTFIDSLEPQEKAEALERGDLMHKILEVYESRRCNLVSPESETWKKLFESGNSPLPNEPFDNFAIRAGRFFSTKMDLVSDEVEETIHQFSEYIKFYASDTWSTIAVESVGSKVLFEDEQIKIIYAFKLDRLASRDGIICAWDYKTSKRRSEVSSLSNQFMGYAWATDSNYVVVDKIGFQKTLKPEERFQRILLSYDQERLNEWHKNAIHWAFKYMQLLAHPDAAEMNLTSCDKYSGCVFKSICDKSPSSREWVIKRDFVVREEWDPAKILEAK